MQRKRYIFTQSGQGAPGGTGRPERGLLGQIIALVVGVAALFLSLFVGAIFIASIVGFVLIAGLIVAGRVWWLKRKVERYQREHGDIEAEYTVIDSDKRRR